MEPSEYKEQERKSALRSNLSPAAPPAPDGGLQAWLQVLVGFLCMFNSMGMLNTYGLWQEWYSNNLLRNNSAQQIAWNGALMVCLFQLGAALVVPLIHAGHLRAVIIAGTLIESFGLMMLSLCKKYWEVMLAQGIIVAFGASLLYAGGLAAATPYFSRRRSLALGAVAVGAPLGGVAYSAIFDKLFAHSGFGWSCRAVGFIVLGLGVIGAACVEWRQPPKGHTALIDSKAFTDVQLVLFGMAVLFASAAFFSFAFYIQGYAVYTNVNAPAAGYTAAIVNAASTVGTILNSLLVSHAGNFNLLLPAYLVCLILTFCWVAVHRSGSVEALATLYGLFSAPIWGLIAPITTALTVHENRLGARTSFVSAFIGLGAIFGPPFAGIIQKQHGWLWLKIYSGIHMTAAFFTALLCRHLVARKSYSHVV